MTDIALRQDVLDELEFDPEFDAAHIGVTAENGIVTLTGHTTSYAEKLAALKAARRVRGVVGIADELQVRYPSDRKTADDQIAARAIAVLNWNTSLPEGALTVTVRNGWVTLAGKVNWWYQKRAAEEGVHKLSGVIGVANNITIVPMVQPADVKNKIECALKRHAETEAAAIRVTVTNADHVVLEGKVGNWEERVAAERAAWSVAGVRAVEDKLTLV